MMGTRGRGRVVAGRALRIGCSSWKTENKRRNRELESLVEGLVKGRQGLRWFCVDTIIRPDGGTQAWRRATGSRKCLACPIIGQYSKTYPYGGLFCSCEKLCF